MSVEIVHMRNKKGQELDKYCRMDNKKCVFEKTDHCNGCAVLSGNPDKPILFSGV